MIGVWWNCFMHYQEVNWPTHDKRLSLSVFVGTRPRVCRWLPCYSRPKPYLTLFVQISSFKEHRERRHWENFCLLFMNISWTVLVLNICALLHLTHNQNIRERNTFVNEILITLQSFNPRSFQQLDCSANIFRGQHCDASATTEDESTHVHSKPFSYALPWNALWMLKLVVLMYVPSAPRNAINVMRKGNLLVSSLNLNYFPSNIPPVYYGDFSAEEGSDISSSAAESDNKSVSDPWETQGIRE